MNTPSRARPAITGILSAKGGAGQSTIALGWARALGEEGHRVLLVELAGGDLAWMAGVTPQRFTEDVCAGRCDLHDAAIALDERVSLLASGNAWAVYGADTADDIAELVAILDGADWTHCVIDFGAAAPTIIEPVLERCEAIALVLTSDIACVARTYALLRRLTELGCADPVSLLFNRQTGQTDADSFRGRFDKLTSQFLGRTWPVAGVVPEAVSLRRDHAIQQCVRCDLGVQRFATMDEETIRKPAEVADNRG